MEVARDNVSMESSIPQRFLAIDTSNKSSQELFKEIFDMYREIAFESIEGISSNMTSIFANTVMDLSLRYSNTIVDSLLAEDDPRRVELRQMFFNTNFPTPPQAS